MDPIKNQISAIDPLTIDPVAEPNGEEALHKILSGTTVFSDNSPLAAVTSLEQRRRRKAQIAGGLLLGAAAVTAGVLVASSFETVSSNPLPAVTLQSSTPTPSVSVTPTTTPTATPSATPSATPTVAAPVTTPPAPTTPPAVASAPVVPPLQAPTSQTYTFPDGHLSFTYPVGWSIRADQGPFDPPGTAEASRIVTVFDAAGAEVARVFNGNYADGTAGMVDRSILDRAVVPGVSDTAGNQVEFGFSENYAMNFDYDSEKGGMPTASGRSDSPPFYVMDVRVSSELQAGVSSSGINQVRVPNGIMSAYVVFDPAKQPSFATPEAAKAWMNTAQYAQLKAMFLSLSYK